MSTDGVVGKDVVLEGLPAWVWVGNVLIEKSGRWQAVLHMLWSPYHKAPVLACHAMLYIRSWSFLRTEDVRTVRTICSYPVRSQAAQNSGQPIPHG